MADRKKTQALDGLRHDDISDERPDNGSTIDAQNFAYTEDRKIGITGAVFLILNKMIGTGIFSTPSSIFAATGSVGISLMLWVIGGFLTFCGLSVFLEFGLAIPRSGGEKNYLERVYRRPRYLATCVLASQMILLGFSSGNSLAFGRYILFASGRETPDGWEARGIAVTCVTFAVLMHSVTPKWGIRLFNVLGVFKVVILLFIVFSGFAALAGHRRVPNPHNFDNAFRIEDGDGYGGGGAYAYSNALLNIIYSYKGWENANYVVSELKHPKKTLAIAAPIAIGGVTILYVLANVAYFAAIPKSDLAKSEVIVAGLFFRNIFGESAAARSLPAFVALSNLGNVLAVSFAHARLNQELAKEGMLPFSRFWASNKPFNAPASALFLHWIVTVIVLLAPPAGPAYNFIVNLYTYPGSWINGFVTAGLIYLHYKKSENWTSPWHTYLPISIIYLLANVFLALVPFIPPDGDWNADGYPYYVFPVVGVGVLILGGVYWSFWTKILPRIGGYKVVADRTFDDSGVETVSLTNIQSSPKFRSQISRSLAFSLTFTTAAPKLFALANSSVNGRRTSITVRSPPLDVTQVLRLHGNMKCFSICLYGYMLRFSLIAGMDKDLNLDSNKYPVVLVVFFSGYVVFEVLSNMILTRTRPSRYLPGIIILMGVLESGFAPGMLLLLSSWYKSEEQSKRFAVYISAAILSGAFGGLLAGSITSGLDGAYGKAGWRWLFVVEGAATMGVAVIAYFILPNFPANTSRLKFSQEEIDLAIRRLQHDRPQVHTEDEEKLGHWQAFKLSMTNWRTWLFVVGYMAIVGSSTLSYFYLSYFYLTLVKGLGYEFTAAQYMTIPIFGVAFVVTALTGSFADKNSKWRGVILCAWMSVAMLCTVIICVVYNFKARYALLVIDAKEALSKRQIKGSRKMRLSEGRNE
ncbi:high-affinity methionine permease [Fusarium napiforme]|uniref:High-affinity methionine permease n=1 Tax=Fusarium napiforme TaxID=42672 RepID=A0A8H5N4L8_9HYPO|nr:high-affinity methionine permease [Fusarium napiforme]